MLLLDVSIGAPETRGPLTLFPLVRSSTGGDDLGYLPGPLAAEQALLGVRENDEGAQVSALVVTNRSDRPVLLIEGEAVLGAKQNRTLNVSVLLPAKEETLIPVSCVEAGRWGDEGVTVRSSAHAPSSLRAYKTRSVNRSVRDHGVKESDQGQVWASVSSYLSASSVDSNSDALEDAFTARRPDVENLVGDLSPIDGQVGLVVAYGGQVRSLDVFDRPETLEAYWSALLQGCGLDALSTEAGDGPGATSADAEAFVRRVGAAEVERGAGTGLGEDLRIDDEVVTGAGLQWNDVVCHLAAFSIDESEDRPTHARGTESAGVDLHADTLQRIRRFRR